MTVTCKPETIDSSAVSLSYVREVCPGVLPTGVEGVHTIGDPSGLSTDITAMSVEYNEHEKEIRVALTVDTPALSTIKLRVNRTRDGLTNVGRQEFAGGHPNWIVNEDAGAVARWDRINPQTATQNLVAVVDLSSVGLIADADVFTIQASDDNFVANKAIVLTITVDGTGLVEWKEIPISEDGDTGAELTLQERTTRSGSRQNRKGGIINLESQAGYSIEITNSSFDDLIQGFLFADTHAQPSTNLLNGEESWDLTEVNADTLVFGTGIAAEFDTGLSLGDLIVISGLSAANNGLWYVDTGDDGLGTVTVTGIASESSVVGAEIYQVGYQGGTGAFDLNVTGAVVTLNNNAINFTLLNLQVGQWIWIGGDGADTRFDQGFGSARIHSISTNAIVLQQVRWKGIVTEAGGAKTIQIFFSDFTRNEKDPALVRRYTYQFERILGSDQVGLQSEYLIGNTANEMSVNWNSVEAQTADFAFIGLSSELRDGGEGLKAGTHTGASDEDSLNSVDHVREMIVYIYDPSRLQVEELVGGVEEASITINNNATYANRIGRLGAFAVNVGNFDVTATITAYFTTVEALRAIRNNADVGFNAFSVFENQGSIFDIPLMSVSGRPDTSDTAVKLPLESRGAEHEYGYTISFSRFHYLPNLAMVES